MALKKVVVFFYTYGFMLYVPYLFLLRLLGKTKARKDFVLGCAKRWGKRYTAVYSREVIVKGAENIPEDFNFVVIANHQNLLDIPLLLGALNKPLAFITKKELATIPGISSYMKTMGCLFIDRANPLGALKVFKKAAKTISEGYNYVIFPEGTRSAEVNKFKKGSFKLAQYAKSAILPVTIIGTDTIGNKSKNPKNKIILIIDKPLMSKDFTPAEFEELPEKIEKQIRDNFNSNLAQICKIH